MGTLYFVAFALGAVVLLSLLVLGAERALRGPIDLKTVRKNAAVALVEAGLLLGTFFVAATSVSGCVEGNSVLDDLLWTSVFGLGGALLLVLSGRVGVLLLVRSRLPAAVASGNTAAGLAAGAHYAATGVILSGCFYGGELWSLVLALSFFVLAQATLYGLVSLFRALTPYDDSEEILSGNIAAALSYGGATLALSIIVSHAASGVFVGLVASLRSYGLSLLFALALYPVRQLLVQWAMLGARPSLRRGALDQSIVEERNAGIGALEASAYIATALLMVSAS
jgi:uncharacterized membrane protein YjfL (UPF0719 family)